MPSEQEAYGAYVYRGVHGKHPRLSDARKGQAIPGDIGGEMTAEEHNQIDLSDASPYTSWTFSLGVARRFARSRPPFRGVVLRCVYAPPGPGDSWAWEPSPDVFHEDEILMRGVRINLEVIDADR